MRKLGHNLTDILQQEAGLHKQAWHHESEVLALLQNRTCKRQALDIFIHNGRLLGIENALLESFDVCIRFSILERIQSLQHNRLVNKHIAL